MDELYSRTARFYAQLLGTGTEAAWATEIAATEVHLSVDAAFARQPGAQRTLLAATNLLARAFGRISIAAPTVACVVDPILVPPAASLGETVEALTAAIQGSVAARPVRRLALHVGPNAAPEVNAIAARGWDAWLWRPGSCPSTFAGDGNPLGSFAAALLGVTATTRAFIAQAGGVMGFPSDTVRMRFGVDLGVVQLSAWDLFGGAASPPPWRPLRTGRVVFSSLGAVNGALWYLLALAEGSVATVEAYEPEALERHNLNRYLYATADIPKDGRKTTAAAGLQTPTLRLTGSDDGIDASATRLPAGALVVSGADNDIARHAAARRAAGWLISLASEMDIAEVSLHELGRSPCLGCVHPGDAQRNLSQPTHPLVAAWPALVAGSYLARSRASWPHGRVIRVLALRPSQRTSAVAAVRPACAICIAIAQSVPPPRSVAHRSYSESRATVARKRRQRA